MDTSYGSFYKWYCSQPSRTPHIKKFKQDILDDIEDGGKNWSDFEIGLGKYTSDFAPIDADVFFECYEDAMENIMAYLEQEKNKVDTVNIPEKDVACLRDGILNFYQELTPQECLLFKKIFESNRENSTTINFISYNYTDVLDKCIATISDKPLKEWEHGRIKRYTKINPQILHIHGTPDEFAILGVSDDTQVANRELLAVPHFSSIMIKSQSVASVGQLWYIQAEELIEKSKIICIWGMSLGSSDSKWWNKITEWLKADQNRHLIIFWHTDMTESKKFVLPYNQQSNKIKDCLLDYSSFPSNEDGKIKDQIHVVFNSEKVLRVSLSPAPEKEVVFT